MKKTFLFFSIFMLLGACTSKVSKSNLTPQKQGGVDPGGSNTILGRPIESYIVNIQNLPEFASLSDVFKKTNLLLPSFSRALSASTQLTRTWYLVPIELKLLPNIEIAIPIQTDTEQYALHYSKSIWISDIERQKIKNRNSGDAAVHLLHEMVMSLRVDQNLKKSLTNSPSLLSTQDYEDIRALTYYLATSLSSTNDLQDFLYLHHFYYSSIIDPSATGLRYPIPTDEEVFKTTDQVFQFFAQATPQTLPGFLLSRMTGEIYGYCSFKAVQSEKEKGVYVNIQYIDGSLGSYFYLHFSKFQERDVFRDQAYLSILDLNPSSYMQFYGNYNEVPPEKITMSFINDSLKDMIIYRKEQDHDENPIHCTDRIQ